MSILEQIVARKIREVEERKVLHPYSELEKNIFFQRQTRSLKTSLIEENSAGIIAEFKRKSPSKGIINGNAIPSEICLKYKKAGASAVSVLTDSEFFGGSLDDLSEVSEHISCPVLRKDFIIDEYQIIEARSAGADAVLLITELHSAERLAQLHDFALSFDLEVLVEVHKEENIPRIPGNAQLIGINSRDLSTFNVNIDQISHLTDILPGNIIKVAESGIRSPEDCLNLKKAGFDAFLIGEYFMDSKDPGKTCETFINTLRKINSSFKKETND
jgi:indole-3-glycerol phosphate synthase